MDLARAAVTVHEGTNYFTVVHPMNVFRPRDNLVSTGLPSHEEAWRFAYYQRALVTLAAMRALTPEKLARMQRSYVEKVGATLEDFVEC